MHVFGQPEMDGVMYVADNGTIRVPLAGPVSVAGLSPGQAAHKVEAALEKGQFLVDPHVTFTIVESLSQQVSVLGQVAKPGVYTVQSNTTVLDLLAQAGGETSQGANTIYILHTGADGAIHRLRINLRGLTEPGVRPEAAEITLRGGDQVYVPRAPKFYVTGQVTTPGTFRLTAGMTVLQAIARAGGVTQLGSMDRVNITRRDPNGKYRVIAARLQDKVKAGDVITVKERIF